MRRSLKMEISRVLRTDIGSEISLGSKGEGSARHIAHLESYCKRFSVTFAIETDNRFFFDPAGSTPLFGLPEKPVNIACPANAVPPRGNQPCRFKSTISRRTSRRTRPKG